MMKDLNCVQLIGHLGADPSVMYTDRGTAHTTFSVATTRSWTDADGLEQTMTEWSRCVSWDKLAEVAAQYLHKGSRVYVQGRLHTSRWEDVQTGEPRSSVEIILDDLILLDRRTPTATLEDVGEPLPSTQHPTHVRAQQAIRRPPNRSTSVTHRLNRRNAAATIAETSDPLEMPGCSRVMAPARLHARF